MPLLRCPHPAHAGRVVALKSNNDRVYECEQSHRFYRRDEGGEPVLADLITGQTFRPEPIDPSGTESPERPRLNFMTDVPRVKGTLDFDHLSLPAAQWKLIAKIDGRSTLEEVRLLAGMKAEEAERIVFALMDAGLIELRSRR